MKAAASMANGSAVLFAERPCEMVSPGRRFGSRNAARRKVLWLDLDHLGEASPSLLIARMTTRRLW
jgi:hypothetical protein